MKDTDAAKFINSLSGKSSLILFFIEKGRRGDRVQIEKRCRVEKNIDTDAGKRDHQRIGNVVQRITKIGEKQQNVRPI